MSKQYSMEERINKCVNSKKKEKLSLHLEKKPSRKRIDFLLNFGKKKSPATQGPIFPITKKCQLSAKVLTKTANKPGPKLIKDVVQTLKPVIKDIKLQKEPVVVLSTLPFIPKNIKHITVKFRSFENKFLSNISEANITRTENNLLIDDNPSSNKESVVKESNNDYNDTKSKQVCTREGDSIIPLKCLACNQLFDCEVDYMNHTKCLVEDQRYPCSMCKSTFKLKSYLKRHMNAMHLGIRPYECHLCDKNYPKNSELKKHIDSAHLKVDQFKCIEPGCEKRFSDRYKLYRHKKHVHEKNFEFACNFCPRTFFTYTHKKVHVDTVHYKIKRFKCPQCVVKFYMKGDLNKHINSVHCKLRPFGCTQCKRCFAENKLLKAHVDSVHNKLRHFKCTKCDFAAFWNYELKSHIKKVHSNVYAHKCHLCEKQYKGSGSLKEHLNGVHYGLRNFECEICGKFFLTKGMMSEHMASHSNEKAYQCTHCNKSFGLKKKLVLHIQSVHMNIRNYKCPTCKKSFHTGNRLKIHQRTVHLKTFKININPEKTTKNLLEFSSEDSNIISNTENNISKCNIEYPMDKFNCSVKVDLVESNLNLFESKPTLKNQSNYESKTGLEPSSVDQLRANNNDMDLISSLKQEPSDLNSSLDSL